VIKLFQRMDRRSGFQEFDFVVAGESEIQL
jgi:hypothetical protein